MLDPRARACRDPRRPRVDRPGLPRLAAVRPRGPVGAARRAGHRQGRDRQPDPLVQGPRHVARGPGLAEAGPDRDGSADRRAPRPGNFGQGVAYAARGARPPDRRLRLAATPTPARSTGCGRSAPRSSRSGEDFDGARAGGRRPRAEAGASCSSTARTRGSRPAPATMALELTDAVEAGRLAGARGHRSCPSATGR